MASRLSIRLSVRNVEVSWSHRLEFFENDLGCLGCSLSANLKISRIYSKGNTRNFGRNRGWVWKKWHSAYESSNICETRQDGTKLLVVYFHFHIQSVFRQLMTAAELNVS